MGFLAFDASSRCVSVAFGSESISDLSMELDQGHAAVLPTLVEKVLGDTIPQAILIVTGPGSFTGIRTSLAFAQGLGLAFNCPVKGLNTFQLVSDSFSQRPLLIGVDAKRKDHYWQFFDENGSSAGPYTATIEDNLVLRSSPHVMSDLGFGSIPPLAPLLIQWALKHGMETMPEAEACYVTQPLTS